MTSAEQEYPLPLAEVAEWHIRLSKGGPEVRAEFLAWVEGLPQRAQAHQALANMETRLAQLDLSKLIDVDKLFPEGIPTRRSGPARRIGSQISPARSVTRAVHVRRLAGAILAIAAAVMVGWAASHYVKGETDYTTLVGEQRPIQLGDGSSMDLNVDSHVQVSYTSEKRDVLLLGGEVFFNVEHDLARPFRVMTERAVVQAQSTQFNIYHRAARTTISVIAGEVSVLLAKGRGTSANPDRQAHAPSSGESDGLTLEAGQQVSIDPDGGYKKVEHADIPNTLLWQKRRLRFDKRPLAEVAEELNRYNTTQIVLADENLGARPISGSFSVDHPETLIHYLQTTDDRLVVEKAGDAIVIRSP
jgi:transmembrane sensor